MHIAREDPPERGEDAGHVINTLCKDSFQDGVRLVRKPPEQEGSEKARHVLGKKPGDADIPRGREHQQPAEHHEKGHGHAHERVVKIERLPGKAPDREGLELPCRHVQNDYGKSRADADDVGIYTAVCLRHGTSLFLKIS